MRRGVCAFILPVAVIVDENKQLDQESTINFPLIDRLFLQLLHKSDRSLFLWVYWRNKPLGMLGKHEKSL